MEMIAGAIGMSLTASDSRSCLEAVCITPAKQCDCCGLGYQPLSRFFPLVFLQRPRLARDFVLKTA
jgi:hypothetical protein